MGNESEKAWWLEVLPPSITPSSDRPHVISRVTLLLTKALVLHVTEEETEADSEQHGSQSHNQWPVAWPQCSVLTPWEQGDILSLLKIMPHPTCPSPSPSSCCLVKKCTFLIYQLALREPREGWSLYQLSFGMSSLNTQAALCFMSGLGQIV